MADDQAKATGGNEPTKAREPKDEPKTKRHILYDVPDLFGTDPLAPWQREKP